MTVYTSTEVPDGTGLRWTWIVEGGSAYAGTIRPDDIRLAEEGQTRKMSSQGTVGVQPSWERVTSMR